MAKSVLQARDVVFTEVVVLVKDADLGVWIIGKQIFCVDSRFQLVGRQPAHGPGVMLGIAPLGCAAPHEQLRHLLDIHIFPDRRVGGCAEAPKDKQDSVVLDQLARHLDRFGRAVAVVIGDEFDLAAVYAAFSVHLVEIGSHGPANRRKGRCRAAIGHNIADLNFLVGHAGAVLLLRKCGRSPESQCKRYGCQHTKSDVFHCRFSRVIVTLPFPPFQASPEIDAPSILGCNIAGQQSINPSKLRSASHPIADVEWA